LIAKSIGFFVTLVCSQFTWWASYSTELHINLYGLSVGFIGLLFGILYTIEMSLIIAQLHGPPPLKVPKFPRVDTKVVEPVNENTIEEQPQRGDEMSDSETVS